MGEIRISQTILEGISWTSSHNSKSLGKLWYFNKLSVIQNPPITCMWRRVHEKWTLPLRGQYLLYCQTTMMSGVPQVKVKQPVAVGGVDVIVRQRSHLLPPTYACQSLQKCLPDDKPSWISIWPAEQSQQEVLNHADLSKRNAVCI